MGISVGRKALRFCEGIVVGWCSLEFALGAGLGGWQRGLPVVKRVRSRPRFFRADLPRRTSVVVTVTVMEAWRERKARIQEMRWPLATEAATWVVEGEFDPTPATLGRVGTESSVFRCPAMPFHCGGEVIAAPYDLDRRHFAPKKTVVLPSDCQAISTCRSSSAPG